MEIEINFMQETKIVKSGICDVLDSNLWSPIYMCFV